MPTDIARPAPHHRRSRRDAIMRMLRGACLLALLGWCAGRVLSDRFIVTQWISWIPSFVPPLLAAAGLVLVAAESPRRRQPRAARAWSAALLGALLFWLAVDNRVITLSARPSSGLSLLHWTIATPVRGRTGLVADVILGADPDIAILTDSAAAHRDPAILAWLGPDHRPRRAGGFVALTRLPVHAFRTLVESEGISAAWLSVEAAAPVGTLDILIVDLPSDPKLSRRAVVERLTALLESADAPAPDVVVGDFNIPRGAASIRRAFPGARHAFDEAGTGWAGTYPRTRPLVHIDHVLLLGDLTSTRSAVLRAGIGRHRPTITHLSRRRSAGRPEVSAAVDTTPTGAQAPPQAPPEA